MTRRVLLFVMVTASCATPESAADGGRDAARRDAGSPDASARDASQPDAATDAGGSTDAGRDDAGNHDAGTDSGTQCTCPRSVGCADEGDIVCAPAPEYP